MTKIENEHITLNAHQEWQRMQKRINRVEVVRRLIDAGDVQMVLDGDRSSSGIRKRLFPCIPSTETGVSLQRPVLFSTA